MPSRYIASARSVSQDIIGDKRVNSLSNVWHIVGYHRVILIMDNLGRCEADPHMVKALVFPRNAYMTPARCRRFCYALHEGGLCYLYTARGEQYLQSPSFHRQTMSGHMERKSLLPAPDPEEYLDWLVNVRQDKRFRGLNLDSSAEVDSSIDRGSTEKRGEVDIYLGSSGEVDNGYKTKIVERSISTPGLLDDSAAVTSAMDKQTALNLVRHSLENPENVKDMSFTCQVHELDMNTTCPAEEKRKRKRREGKEKEKGSDSDPPHTDPNLQSPLSLRPSLSDSQKEAEFDHVVDSFHAHLDGDLTPQIATAIRQLLLQLEPTTIVDAMTTAQKQLGHKPDWPYVKAILNNWLCSRDTRAPNTTSARRAAKRQVEDRDKYVKGRYGHLVRRGTPGDVCDLCHKPIDDCQCLDSQETTTPDS